MSSIMSLVDDAHIACTVHFASVELFGCAESGLTNNVDYAHAAFS